MREQSQRAATLDDGQHLEPPSDTDQVGNGGVPRFMSGDGVSIGLRVVGHLFGADLLRELRLHHVFEVHPLSSLAERHQQGFVEQVLDHDRGVAERLVRDPFAIGIDVQSLVVGLPSQEEIDQVSTLLLRRKVEVQTAVEPPRTKEGGIEGVAAVGRRDQQDVVVLGPDRVELAVGREVSVHPRDQLAPHPVPPRPDRQPERIPIRP